MSIFLIVLFIILLSHQYLCISFPSQNELPLRTSGRWIVNQQGNRVKLACMNWHGAHMNAFVPSGLNQQTARSISSTLRRLGFNCVRLNWSEEMVITNPVVNHDAIRSLKLSGDIKDENARALDVFDLVISALTEEKIMTIIDNHMSDAGWCCDVRDENSLWFNDRYPVDVWESTWEFMAERYANNPYVIGADLRNELRPDIRFHGKISWRSMPNLEIRMPSWGGGDMILPLKKYAPEVLQFDHPALNSTRHRLLLYSLKKILANAPIKLYDWHSASQKTANKILAKNPNFLIFIQGTFDIYSYTPNVVQIILYYLNKEKDLYNAVGKYFKIPNEATKVYQLQNLTGIAVLPVQLNEPNRLVYSAHLYPFFYDSAQYAWDGKDPSYEEYSRVIDEYWGYIFKQEYAPVWVGETGTKNSFSGVGSKWKYYNNRYLIENDLDFAYWPIGDSRPIIDSKTGEYKQGYDKFALLNSTYNGIKFMPLYQSMETLLQQRLGPGGSDAQKLRLQQN